MYQSKKIIAVLVLMFTILVETIPKIPNQLMWLAIPILICISYLTYQLKDIGKEHEIPQQEDKTQYLSISLIAMFIMLLTNFLYVTSNGYELVISGQLKNWHEIARTVIMAPFVEELLFREYIYGRNYQQYGKRTMCIITIILFVVWHAPTRLDMILVYSVAGIMLQIVYMYSKNNVKYSIITHLLHNLIILI